MADDNSADHDVMAASFDWSIFEMDFPDQQDGSKQQECNNIKAAAPLMPSQRSSDSSPGGAWSDPSLPADNQHPPLMEERSHTTDAPVQGGLEAAWAFAQAASAKWSTRGAIVPEVPLGPTISRGSSAVAAEMSWSLPKGLLQPAALRVALPEEKGIGLGRASPSWPAGGVDPLGGQLSGIHPCIQRFVPHAPEPLMAVAPCGQHSAPQLLQSTKSGGNTPRGPPPPSSFSSQHMSAPQHAFYNRVLSLNPTAALKQLTEVELRRKVQQQVMTLISNERDLVQAAWLNELLEISKTSSLAVLGTLRQQLDVLLQPLPPVPPPQAPSPPLIAEQRRATDVAAPVLKVEPIDWQAACNADAGGGSLCDGDAVAGNRHVAPAQGRPIEQRGTEGIFSHRSLSSLPVSQAAGGGSGPQKTLSSFRSLPSAPSCGQQGRVGSGAAARLSHPSAGNCQRMSSRKRGLDSAAGGEGGAASRDAVQGGGVEAASTIPRNDPRWWRRQNNFTLTIDDIVKKMRSQGCADANMSRPSLSVAARSSADGGARHINADRVRQVYHKPLKEAAKVLSVSVMSLKRTCRKMGVSRWPYRKLASLSELEVTVREDLLEQQLPTGDKEAVMQYIEVEKAAIMLEPDRNVDQLLLDLRKAKIHMKYEKWGRRALGSCRGDSASGGGGVGACNQQALQQQRSADVAMFQWAEDFDDMM